MGVDAWRQFKTDPQFNESMYWQVVINAKCLFVKVCSFILIYVKLSKQSMLPVRIMEKQDELVCSQTTLLNGFLPMRRFLIYIIYWIQDWLLFHKKFDVQNQISW